MTWGIMVEKLFIDLGKGALCWQPNQVDLGLIGISLQIFRDGEFHPELF